MNQVEHSCRWLPRVAILARALAVFLLVVCCAAAQANEPKHVLILMQEDVSWPAFRTIDENLRASIRAGLPPGSLIFSEHLDRVHFPDPQFQADQAVRIQQKYAQSKIDLVIGVGDVPTDLFPAVPLVYLRTDPSEGRRSQVETPADIVNLWIQVDARKTLEAARRLQPHARQLVIIGSTSRTGQNFVAQVREQIDGYTNGLSIVDLTGSTFEETSKMVSTLGPDSIVLFVSFSRDGAGHPFISAEALQNIAAASGAPVYGLLDTHVGSGAVGGYVVRFAEMGKRAGELGLQLLAGAHPNDEVVSSEYLFDWRELRRWNIPESLLPAGSVVLYRRPNFWDTYKYYIAGAVLLCLLETLLIVALLWQRARRRRTEQSLADARSRHAAIVESSDDAIVSKNLDGIIVTWNAGARHLYGYSEAEAVGKPIAMIIPEELQAEEAELLRRLRAGERVEHYETERIAKNGNRVIISLTMSSLRDLNGKVVGYAKIARDITDRKRAELDLRESEERFRLVADTAPVLIWMSGTDKLCNFFNQGWLNFTGRPIEAELGNGWSEAVHPEDLQRCVDSYSSCFDARVDFEMEYRLRRFDGEYRWIVDYGVPRFESDGTFCGYIGSCVDITEKKLSAESLNTLSGRLIMAQDEERARIARELHDDFSQSLALQCIDIEQLRKKLPALDAEEQARLVKMLRRAKALSADIRSLSHELHSSRLELIGLVPALSGLCKEIGEKYNIDVQFVENEGSAEIPKDVALCLFRVTQEALGNVVKHSEARRACVVLVASADSVSLRITDEGSGFNPGVTSQATGIGLVGMKERLRLVGGKLSIWSEISRGTEILAEVPLRASASEIRVKTVAAGGIGA